MSTQPTARREPLTQSVTLVAPAGRVAALRPLLAAWGVGCPGETGPQVRRVRLVDPGPQLPGPVDLRMLAAGTDALLVVGPRARSPRTVLPGPVVHDPSGRAVPAGWLPDVGDLGLRRFATAAAQVHARATGPGALSVAVLGQRHSRFDRLADRVLGLVREQALPGARWTAYDLHRDDLVARLSQGPAVSVYVGHGRPVGWVGYAGLRAQHLGLEVDPGWRPGAVVLSLTCRTASRRRTAISFAESLVLRGVAAATLAAVGSTLHTDNARRAVAAAGALGGARTVGDLVTAVAERDPHPADLRLIGDPTAPLLDASGLDLH